jgi:hypothetical protein
MQTHILRIAKQEGTFTLDEAACLAGMKDCCTELFQEESKTPDVPQAMFRCVDGKLQIFGGGYDASNEWGIGVNLWGYAELPILKVLAQHLWGKGKITLSMDNEGNPPAAYVLTVDRGFQGKGNHVRQIL